MSDLAELFARDPLKLTREDVGAIVERLRAARAQFAAGGEKAKAAGKVPNLAKQEAARKALADLGL